MPNMGRGAAFNPGAGTGGAPYFPFANQVPNYDLSREQPQHRPSICGGDRKLKTARHPRLYCRRPGRGDA